MLRDLHVENLAVISETSVEFGTGLNTLTGETGAGKSIVVDSLALLSGVRASTDLIRKGADVLRVIGVFEPTGRSWRSTLQEAGVDPSEDQLIVRREISRQGPNRVFLNDRPISLGLLAELAPHLIRIHTQREELGLVSAEVQRAWLDRSGGVKAEKLLAEIAGLFENYDGLKARLGRARGDEQVRAERADLLRFQISEIDAARLSKGEDVELRHERDVLRNAETIAEALGRSYDLVFEEEGSALEKVALTLRQIQQIEEWESRSSEWSEQLTTVRVTLEELGSELRTRLDAISQNPTRLDAIEERLALIDRLCRKYGDSVDQVLDHRDEIGRELEEFETDFEQQDDLREKVDEAFDAYRTAAQELSRERHRWGRKLAKSVEKELADLALDKARFEVRLGYSARQDSPLEVSGVPCSFGSHGFDQVSFELAANPGEAMAPLAKSASGGELSRIYLAVQLASSGRGSAGGATLVFDEVDSGVGGAEAASLGDKLSRLSRGAQILVVTHLPQVASQADQHFRVHKTILKGRTITEVDRLNPAGRVEEVARMLGGKEVTLLSISHAEEMIASALQRND